MFRELRRSLQSPPSGQHNGLATAAQREPGTTTFTTSRSDLPKGVLAKHPENRRPLFHTSQDKSRQVLVPIEQRGPFSKDTPETEFPKSRSTIPGSRPPIGEAIGLSDRSAAPFTAESPPTQVSDDEKLARLYRTKQNQLIKELEKRNRAHDAVLEERDLLQEYLASANSRIEQLTAQIETKKDESRQIREKVQDLRTSMEEQHAAFYALQDSHRTMAANVGELKSNASGLRSATSEALESASRVLETASKADIPAAASKAVSNSDAWLLALRESRAVTSELRGQLESSQEVVTILRDKLHHLASVVAEYKLRIEELETEKKASFVKIHQDYEELKAHYEHSASLEKKVEDLAERLVAREVETFDCLANAVTFEERWEAAKSEITRLTSIISDQEPELASLRKAKEEHLESLLAAHEVANAKDKELVAIRAEIQNQVESKEELKALLSEAKKTITEKDQELLRRDQTLDGARTELACLKQEHSRLLSSVNEERQAHQQKMDSNLATYKELVSAQEQRALSAVDAFNLSKQESATDQLRIAGLLIQNSQLTSSLHRACNLLAEKEKALAKVSSRSGDAITNLETLMTASPNEEMAVLDFRSADGAGKSEAASHLTTAAGAEASFKQLALMNSDSDDDTSLSESSSISGNSGVRRKRIRLDSASPASAQSKRRGKNTAANKQGRPGVPTTMEKATHDVVRKSRSRQVKGK